MIVEIAETIVVETQSDYTRKLLTTATSICRQEELPRRIIKLNYQLDGSSWK